MKDWGDRRVSKYGKKVGYNYRTKRYSFRITYNNKVNLSLTDVFFSVFMVDIAHFGYIEVKNRIDISEGSYLIYIYTHFAVQCGGKVNFLVTKKGLLDMFFSL